MGVGSAWCKGGFARFKWYAWQDSNLRPVAPEFTERRLHQIAAVSRDAVSPLCSCGLADTSNISKPLLPTSAYRCIIRQFRGGLRHRPRHTEWAADRDEGTLSLCLMLAGASWGKCRPLVGNLGRCEAQAVLCRPMAETSVGIKFVPTFFT